MRSFLKSVLVAAVIGVASPAWAVGPVHYSFDVLYSGGGAASLAAGSDNPVGQSMVDGDSFDWAITAQGADVWRVQTGGSFFPLMAFGVNESGDRVGDFTLNLLSGGAVVYTLTQSAVGMSEVHMGTNEINLVTGLVFDQMKLQYSLITARELLKDAADPANPMPINSTPYALLPIFGAPEMSTVSPGIIYGPVPEPAAWALMLCGGALVSLLARRRRG